MEAASIGVKLASSVVTPLVKKLFVAEGPGAGLVEKPVRVSEFVSFKGEKRALAEKELTKLAAELVRRAVKSEGERPLPVDEEPAVVHALARTLHSLGDLDMTDVQAVRLGHQTLALHLRVASEAPTAISPSTPPSSTSVSSKTPACTSCTSSPSAPPLWPARSSSRPGGRANSSRRSTS